jgi:hypothetical protein
MKRKAKTAGDAMKLQLMMQEEGVACDIELDHRTLRFANLKAWKRVMKRWDGMKVVRKAAESRSMMEEGKLL